MRFMLIIKASDESEAGVLPSRELVTAMNEFNEEMLKAGVLIGGDGLHPSSKGARVKFSPDGQRTVVDGPFAETKELIAGYWMIEVESKEEAIQWALRTPAPMGEAQEGEIEIRQVFDVSDFPPDILSPEEAEREREILGGASRAARR